LFGVPPANVRVISPHVGGGFGSKGGPWPYVVIAALAARHVGRPVKLAVTRQQMFAVTGYRTPTIQRVRLGANADGRLTAIVHDAFEQSSTITEFAEQTTTPTRVMYAAPHRRTTTGWSGSTSRRRPGCARPASARGCSRWNRRWTSWRSRARSTRSSCGSATSPTWIRRAVWRSAPGTWWRACAREHGGSAGPTGTPRRVRRQDGLLIGTGVAASTYPVYRRPSQATAQAHPDGRFTVRIAAADIGTGARTVLTQIAADTLRTSLDRVRVEIGDSALPTASLAGGSMGTASWAPPWSGPARR